MSRDTAAGAAYNDLRNKAQRDKRSVSELQTLYALEGFLARLAASADRERFVFKGGLLLAAYGERRPTRDIDLVMQDLARDADNVLSHLREMAAISLDPDDGLVFDRAKAAAKVIRDEAEYTGVRVSMTAQLATARIGFHLDISVGDPIIPDVQTIAVPRLLDEQDPISLQGCPMEMVYAEKLSTAVSLGTVNTRMRDYGDVYTLSRHHKIKGDSVILALEGVAQHRGVELVPLAELLTDYADQRQTMWAKYRKDNDRSELPESFAEVLSSVIAFADPAITRQAAGSTWDPSRQAWSRLPWFRLVQG